MKTFKSDLSHELFPLNLKINAKTLRPSILSLIKEEYPNFSEDDFLSSSELNYFREKYISGYLIKQKGKLTILDKKVIDSITDETILTEKLEFDDNITLTYGQKIADRVATFGGSWTFIISFGVFLFIWILTNVLFLSNNSFDPFPFILLNLILSCIAAMQAPVIMMSQNRQEEKDRDRAKRDYMINLKSELEIRNLHEKIDHLIINQQEEILEIQKVQIEMMNDILKNLEQK